MALALDALLFFFVEAWKQFKGAKEQRAAAGGVKGAKEQRPPQAAPKEQRSTRHRRRQRDKSEADEMAPKEHLPPCGHTTA